MARARIIDSEAEAPPQSDQLAGWPHPRETGTLHGQPQAEATIADAIASGRLHHGWLITGEEGTGKATFAYRIARFLLAQPEALPGAVPSLDAPDERTTRQIASLAHPGLFVVRRAWDSTGKKFRQTIAADEVRALRHFLQRTAATPWRVVVVDTSGPVDIAEVAAAIAQALADA